MSGTPTGIGGDKPGKTGNAAQDAARRQQLDLYLWQTFGAKQSISWHDTADIADWIAAHTSNDHDFRRDLWTVFGWRADGQRSPWAALLDKTNQGLKPGLLNEGRNHRLLYSQEQMHHYLGGVTGNFDWFPTHLRNNLINDALYELRELFAAGHYNLGDVRLFRAAKAHRDDFLTHGRFIVGANIRKLLNPVPQAWAQPSLQSPYFGPQPAPWVSTAVI